MIALDTRRRLGVSLLLAATLSACASAAPSTAPAPGGSSAAVAAAARTITAEDMARRIGFLASDEMRGRDTPSPELEAAARYIAEEFRSFGLLPAGDSASYIQRYTYRQARLEAPVLRVRGHAATAPSFGTQFFLVAGPTPRVEAPAYYAGTAGSAAALPAEARGAVALYDLPIAQVGAEWQAALTAALQHAGAGGAAAVGLLLHPQLPGETLQMIANSVGGQQAPIPLFGVLRPAAEAMFAPAGIRLAGAPVGRLGSAVVEVGGTRGGAEHRVPNVVAMLPGSDPVLKDSYVVITAHFDHVGVGRPDASGDSIYNGADDNASGTAGLIEIAQAFAALPQRPARSIVFLAVSGEEKGLLGSMYYASNPTVPMSGIVMNLNMDMISRNAPDTLIAIGQEYSTLEQVLSQVLAENPDLGLTVIRDPMPQENLFFRSDQLSFIQKNVPSLFFFTGLHEDYHRPSDQLHRVDPDKAARVSRLGFLVAHRVATTAEPPAWTPEGRRQIDAILGRR